MTSPNQPDRRQRGMYQSLRQRVERQQLRRHEQIRQLVERHHERPPRSRRSSGR